MRRALTTWKAKNDKLGKEASKFKVRERPTSLVLSGGPESSESGDTDKEVPPDDDTVNVRVGQPGDVKVFRLSRRALFDKSLHFSLEISPTSNSIILPHDDPIIFGLFAGWLKTQARPVPYEPLCYSEEPWRSKAAHAWILAMYIKADAFETYALSQFIINCCLVDLDVWEMVEREVQENSTLRRFCNHWIAWNCWLTAPAEGEYAELKGASRQSWVTDDTRDPRTFDLEHWYFPCGDALNPTCKHDPTKRRMEELATSNRGNKAKNTDLGYTDLDLDWEIKINPTRSKSSKRF